MGKKQKRMEEVYRKHSSKPSFDPKIKYNNVIPPHVYSPPKPIEYDLNEYQGINVGDVYCTVRDNPDIDTHANFVVESIKQVGDCPPLFTLHRCTINGKTLNEYEEVDLDDIEDAIHRNYIKLNKYHDNPLYRINND